MEPLSLFSSTASSPLGTSSFSIVEPLAGCSSLSACSLVLSSGSFGDVCPLESSLSVLSSVACRSAFLFEFFARSFGIERDRTFVDIMSLEGTEKPVDAAICWLFFRLLTAAFSVVSSVSASLSNSLVMTDMSFGDFDDGKNIFPLRMTCGVCVA